MSVPFERVGEGQSIRYVIQVMGDNGPISNPSGIRYLPPGQDPAGLGTLMNAGASGASMLGAAASLANLGVGIANLALSGVLLKKVNALGDKVDKIAAGVERIEARQQEILDAVARIARDVSEDKLRQDMKYHLTASVSGSVTGDTVDLNRLDRCLPSIELFMKEIQLTYVGAQPGLQLSSELRDALAALHRLLWGARLSAARASFDALGYRLDIQPGPMDFDPRRVVALVALDEPLRITERRAAKHAGDVHVGGKSTRRYVKREFKKLREQRQELNKALDRDAVKLATLLEPHLEPIRSADDLTHALKTIADYLTAWRLTDAALLWMTRDELQRRQDKPPERVQQVLPAPEAAGPLALVAEVPMAA